MPSTILIFKCPNCGSWNHLETEIECFCGILIHEPGDRHGSENNTAKEVIDLCLNEAVRSINNVPKGKYHES